MVLSVDYCMMGGHQKFHWKSKPDFLILELTKCKVASYYCVCSLLLLHCNMDANNSWFVAQCVKQINKHVFDECTVVSQKVKIVSLFAVSFSFASVYVYSLLLSFLGLLLLFLLLLIFPL